MIVPDVPAIRSAASSRRPITAGLPVALTKRQAASIFGPIDPLGNAPAPRASSSPGVVRPMGRARSVPWSSSTLATSVRRSSRSAPSSRARRAAVRSLSITASTPRRSPSAPRLTGIPPPPAQMTTAPLATSVRIVASSSGICGSGEATTRRHESPSGRTSHPRSRGDAPALLLGVDLSDELGGMFERRVVGVHQRLAHQAHHLVARQRVLEGLQEEVADHPLGLGPQNVEGVGVGQGGVLRTLECQQPDLGSVAVGDHQVVGPCHRGQRLDGTHHVLLLDLRGGDVAPLQEGVAAQGHHHPHLSPPGWPPWPP